MFLCIYFNLQLSSLGSEVASHSLITSKVRALRSSRTEEKDDIVSDEEKYLHIGPHRFLGPLRVLSDAPIVSDEHNMPEGIARDERETILLLQSLSRHTNPVHDVSIKVGKEILKMSSWHFVERDPIKVTGALGHSNMNMKQEYVDFNKINSRPELYRWQRISALIVRALHTKGGTYTNRLYLSGCMWYHGIVDNNGGQHVRRDFLIISIFVSRCERRYISATVAHLESEQIFHLVPRDALAFFKCGWCVRNDANFNIKLWNILEDQLLQKIIYDSDKMVPIDVTTISTIDTRNKVPSFQKHYDKWRIAPGPKKSLAEEAAIIEIDRIELKIKQQNEKQLKQLHADKNRKQNEEKELKKRARKEAKEKKSMETLNVDADNLEKITLELRAERTAERSARKLERKEQERL